MSVLDKFLNVMKINDDYEEEDYLDDEADDFEEEQQPRKHLLRHREDDLFDDEADEEPVSKTITVRPSLTDSTSAAAPAAKPRTSGNKISSIRSRRRSEPGMEVCVIKPHTMEDAREITETLLANCTVVLNVEGLELEIAQRIIDFASGSCYAIDGNLQKISQYIFIITPATVDISGDFQEILSGAFDVPFDKNY